MTAERLDISGLSAPPSTAADLRTHQEAHSDGWLADNVLHPFINGTGVIQIYDTIVDKKAEPLHVEAAKPFTLDWGVQALSGAAGAILPYVAAAKLTGGGLSAIGAKLEVQGLAGSLLASQTGAQILGAGLYDFAKKPYQGETRIGNAGGVMAGFAVFGGGNKVAQKLLPEFSSALGNFALRGSGRFAVGTLGGLSSYEVSNRVSNALGEHNHLNWNGRWQSMATGGIVNFGLPLVQEGAQRLIDYRSLTTGRGLPVERHLKYTQEKDPELQQLARDNRLARVIKIGPGQQSSTAIGKNIVRLAPEDGPQALAQQLQQLRLAKLADPSAELSIRPAAEPLTRPAAEQLTRPAATVVEKPLKPDAIITPLDKLAPGQPTPLGATVTDAGINFAIAAPGATKMELLVYSDGQAKEPSSVVPLTSTNGTWHQFVQGLPPGTLYQYRAYGDYAPAANGARFNGSKVLLDPYAKAVTGSELPMNGDDLSYDNSNPQDPSRGGTPSIKDNASEMPKAVAVKADDFNWQGDHLLGTPMQDSIIYEMNLRGFTASDASLPAKLRGTYEGLIERIPHLKALGITAVELMPITQIDRSAWPGKNPLTGEALTDQWGYNPLVYMAPDSALSAEGSMGQQVNGFKSMVKALHENNIEVMLDVVYNHTREGNGLGPTVNYKGLANDKYYLLKPGQPDQYVDHTGCGNTVSTNDPITMKLVLDSLRYWVEDMHVDGFRFDLASIFKYDADGTVKDKTPILQAIENDPVLSKVKLVAEPWSTDQYDEGHFADKDWSEWRGKFRDTVRKFVKSDTGQVAQLADYIAGSPSLFDQSTGRNPINPVTVHDGFTLNDLVTYQEKHNLANGQNNQDGTGDNYNWNAGVEGPVDKVAGLSDAQKASITQLRTTMMKSMRIIQMMSQGTPILLWGDEVRRTADGNNNYWVQEKANEMPWDKLAENQDMVRFNQMINQMRSSNAIGRRGPQSIIWHGTEPNKPDFSDGTRFIALEYKATKPGERPLYMASNSYWEPLQVKLPEGRWHQLINASLPEGQDIVTADKAPLVEPTITISPRSTIVLQQEPAGPEQGAQK